MCECVLLNIEIYYTSLAVVLKLNQLMFVMYVLESFFIKLVTNEILPQDQ